MGLNDRGLGLKHICQHALHCFIAYELALGLRYDSNQRSTILQKGKSEAKVYFLFLFTDATLYEKLKPFHVNIVAS